MTVSEGELQSRKVLILKFYFLEWKCTSTLFCVEV